MAIPEPQKEFQIVHDAQTQHEAHALDLIYQSAIGAMTDGVVILDATGKLVTANTNALRTTGLTLNQLRNVSQCPPPLDMRLVDGTPVTRNLLPLLQTLADGQSRRDVILDVTRPDGAHVWLLVNTHLLHSADADGDVRVSGVMATLHDITTQYQLSLTVMRQESLYRALIEHASDIISHHAADGTITFVSPSCQKLLGYEP